MRDGLVAAAGAVLMPVVVPAALVVRRAMRRVLVAVGQLMLVHVALVGVVQVAVVEVVGVAVVHDRRVAATRAVLVAVVVVGMPVMAHV
jgi:hypothetical protein